MKFKLPLFLWLSSVLVAGVFFWLGHNLPGSQDDFGQALPTLGKNAEETNMLLQQWPLALKSLGLLIGIGSTILFLVGKNFGGRLYAGIFAALIIISIVAASAVSTFIKL